MDARELLSLWETVRAGEVLPRDAAKRVAELSVQPVADFAQIGERRDTGREAALALGFRRGKALPQLGQRVAADHRCQQQPVRL